MDYNLLPEYEDLLNMDYIDITNIYKSNKPIIAFQHKSEVGRKPKYGDIRYVIQKSGYIRNPVYDKGWHSSGRILSTFEANSPDFKEIGVILLTINLKLSNGLIERSEAYKLRAQIKTKGLIKYLFEIDPISYNHNDIAFLEALNGENNSFKKILDMIENPLKIYQGIVKLAKELSI